MYPKGYYQKDARTGRLKSRVTRVIPTWRTPTALFAALGRLPAGAVVLDMGCGDGTFAERLCSFRGDLHVIGIDLTLQPASGSYSRVSGSALALPLRTTSVDFLIARHLLEHLTDPLLAASEIQRVLKASGVAYVECPDVRSASAWSMWNFYDDPTHVRPYTIKALTRLMAMHGIIGEKVGRIRDWYTLLLGPLYLPIALWLHDREFLPNYLRHVFGLWIYFLGTKSRLH